MESLHLSFSKVMDTGLYKGLSINESFTLSHLFYADDVVLWGNVVTLILTTLFLCFNVFLASGLKININKSKLMGIDVSSIELDNAAKKVGCATLTTPFHYLGVKVGGSMSRKSSWTEVICKLSSRLSKWKIKTLSVGGRLTLIKSVLTAIPLYHMSMFKVPKCVSNKMEAFPIYGSHGALEGTSSASRNSLWLDIIQVLSSLKTKGIDLLGFAKNKSRKDISVAEKMSHSSLAFFFRRMPRGGVEEEQFNNLNSCTSAFILSQIKDRWVWSLSSTVIIMAQQQHATYVHPDKLCPPNKRYDLMDANKKVDFKQVQCPPESKILTNIIKNHLLRFNIAASSSVPWIYMAQFWHTLKEDGSKYRLTFMLDKKELSLTLDDFRTIFHLPQATDNNHDSCVPTPSFLDGFLDRQVTKLSTFIRLSY
ncbi:hypothetical protein Tco_0870742 [Tanacetum coccineum]